ncbi:hypothetical protein A1O3_08121 [Capronia epimyces CBS 606.96]|uniref:Uncharacterized protein n=1 Tax=Capronia epimyces CBS 606.96 TaxID=1182542 RepID=W9XSA0_9EURO|nr:uncharacterized protein A1O3_08121 [Capronia epimyces CBS 606.96]EXJ79836.1 hypothetical protein A1O3_08121 [Capronia epimyces CBS 606.96]
MAQRITPEGVQAVAVGAALFGVLSWQVMRQGHIDIDIGKEKTPERVDTSSSSVDVAVTTAPPAPRVLSTRLLSTIGTGLISTPPSATPLTTFYWATHDENYRIIDYQEVVGWRVGNLKGDLPSSSYSTAVVGDASPNAAHTPAFETASTRGNESNASSSAFATFMASKWQDLVVSHLEDGSAEQLGIWLVNQTRTQLAKTLGFVVRSILKLTDVMGLFAFLVVALVGRYSWFLCKELPSLSRRYASVLAYLVQSLVNGLLARGAESLHGLTVAWEEARGKYQLRKLELENAIREAKLRARMLDEQISKLPRPVAPVDQSTQTDALPAPAPAPATVLAPGPALKSPKKQPRKLPRESPFFSGPNLPTGMDLDLPLSSPAKPQPKSRAPTKSINEVDCESSDEEELARFREKTRFASPVTRPSRRRRTSEQQKALDEWRAERAQRAQMKANARLSSLDPGMFPTLDKAAASDEDVVASDEQTQPTMQQAESTSQEAHPAAVDDVVVGQIAALEAMPQQKAQSSPPAMPGAWDADEEPEKAPSEADEAPSSAETPEVAAESEIPAGVEDFRPPTTPPPQSQQDKTVEEEEKDADDNDGKDNDDDDDSDDDDDTKPSSEGSLSAAALSPAPNAEPPSDAALPAANVSLSGVGQEAPRAAGSTPRGILRSGNSTRQVSARVRFAEETNTYHFPGDRCPMEAEDSVDVVVSMPTPVPTLPEPEAPQAPQMPEVVEGESERAQVDQQPTPWQQTLVRPTELEEAVRTRGATVNRGRRQIRPIRRRLPRREPGQGSSSSVFSHCLSTAAATQPESEPVQPSQQPDGLFPGLVNSEASTSAAGISTTPEVDMEEGGEEPPAVDDSFDPPSETMDVDWEEPPSETNAMEVDADIPAAETNANNADGEVQTTTAPVQLPPGAYVGEDGVIELGMYTGEGERDPAVIAYREHLDSESESCSDSSEDSADFEQLNGNLDIDEDGYYRSSADSDLDGDAVGESESEESASDEESEAEDSDLYGSPPGSPTFTRNRLSDEDLALAQRYWPELLEKQGESEEEDEEEDAEEDEGEDEEEDGREGPGGGSGGQGGGDNNRDGDAGHGGGTDGNGDAVKEPNSNQETDSRHNLENASQNPSPSQPQSRQEQPPSWRQVMDAIEGLPPVCWVEPSKVEMVIENGQIVINGGWVADNPGFTFSTTGKNFIRCNEKFRVQHGWRLIRNCEEWKAGKSHWGP